MNKHTDLIKRLREGQSYDYETGDPRDMSSIMDDAADALQSLTQNLEGHKTQAAEDCALIFSLTAERDAALFASRYETDLCQQAIADLEIITAERDALKAQLDSAAVPDEYLRGIRKSLDYLDGDGEGGKVAAMATLKSMLSMAPPEPASAAGPQDMAIYRSCAASVQPPSGEREALIEAAYMAERAKHSPFSWPARDWFYLGVRTADMLAADAPDREMYQYQYVGPPERVQIFEYLDEDRWVLCRTLYERQEIERLIANDAPYKMRVLKVIGPGSSVVEPHASESVAGSIPASGHPELQSIAQFGELQNQAPQAREQEPVAWRVFIDSVYDPRRLLLSIGVQRFDIAVEDDADDPGRMEWFRDMLTKAMSRLQAPQAREPSDAEIMRQWDRRDPCLHGQAAIIWFARAVLAARSAP